VAFDLGVEINLARAKQLIPAEFFELPRQARTPTSIGYEPPPLRLGLERLTLSLPGVGDVVADADATVFDFGGASAALHIPWEASAATLSALARGLGEPAPLVKRAADALKTVYDQILPAIESPHWSELHEEYIVFQLLPEPPLPEVSRLLAEHAQWLAGLVRLDSVGFSSDEVQEALRLRLSYSASDLAIVDWAAAVIVDRQCDETLETMAFANLQLLEFRHIDRRLDLRLQDAYRLIHQLARTWLPFWRSHTRPLRALGEFRVEVHEMMERSSNVLKLIGDQYLSRLHQILAARFHFDGWSQSVRHSLDALEGIYQVVADQAATLRSELLEWIIIALIALEIILVLVGH
jgi:hypothetical protein